MYLISVLIEHPVNSLDHPFTYLNQTEIPLGVRVHILFHGQSIVGYVLDSKYTDKTKKQLEEEAGFRYAYIKKIIDQKPLLNKELMELADRMSELLLCPRIACLQTMLPRSLKPNSSKGVQIKTLKAVRVIKEGEPKTPIQKELYAFLKSKGIHLVKDLPYSSSPLKGLINQHLIEIYDQQIDRNPYVFNEMIDRKSITLTDDQKYIVESIMSKTERISLIQGVTGSGKTEVYLELTKRMLLRNKNVLMLVPEISLTPMMVNVFKQRFHEDVAIFHSRLSEGEKYDEYRRIAQGKVHIVVGARSAIFVPLDHIGMIIMDEEHDSSYKQDNNPRYHTLTIAKERAHYHHAHIVLGSATPSIESYARAQKGTYDLYRLQSRINNKPLPRCEIVDMSEEARNHHHSIMSELMKKHIQTTLDKNEQVILLLNKRGYASFVKCENCETLLRCPHCDVTLTYHKETNNLKCHYCEFNMPFSEKCPNCQEKKLKKIGFGTQRIEEELSDTFKEARVIRFDFDTTRNKNDHLRLLEAFSNHEGNILLGTQMIAKGLDFPDVTFVGVLMADASLTMPDYRAGERTFQLLTQVAGRSGRSEKEGHVLIQTFNPHHYSIKYGALQDYQSFYKQEMEFRKLAIYPPFCHMLSVIITSFNENSCREASSHIKIILNKYLRNSVVILGPSPATIFKMQDQYRMRIMVKYKKSDAVYSVMKQILDYYKKNRKVIVGCDFHPYNQI